MKIVSLFALTIFLLPEAAFAANQFSWHINYQIQPSGGAATYAERQGGPFASQTACFSDQGGVYNQLGTSNPGAMVNPATIYCSCFVPITSQPGGGCPTSGTITPALPSGGVITPPAPGGTITPALPSGGVITPTIQNPSIGIINPLSAGTNLEAFLASILQFIIRIGTVIIILMLVYIGYLFATTSVSPENKNKAKEALLWTVVGALILLGAQAIQLGIQATVQAISAGH